MISCAVDRAALAEHEELQQLELLVGERRDLAVEQHALAGDVDHDAALRLGRLGRDGLAVLGERGRILEREAHDVDIASARAERGEGDGGIGLGLGHEVAAPGA